MDVDQVSASAMVDAGDPVGQAFQDYRLALQMLRLHKAIKNRSRKLSGQMGPTLAVHDNPIDEMPTADQ